MTTFIESQHPRAAAGTFTDKTQTSPEVLLETGVDFGDEIRNSAALDEGRDVNTYTLNGLLHRTDGPAVEQQDEDRWREDRFYINGEEVSQPGGEDDLYLRHVYTSGVQEWSAGSGERTAVRYPDGTEVFFTDGDLDRRGGPAIIHPNGTGSWYSRGTQLPEPFPAEPTQVRDGDVITETGSKYRVELTTAQIKARLQDDLHNATRAGILEDLGVKYEVVVNKSRGTHPDDITVRVTGLPGWRIRRDTSIVTEDMSQPFLSDEALAIERVAARIAGSYAKTVTNAGDDRVRANYFSSVSFVTSNGQTL